jgi:exonuclease VII large subunit
MDTDDLLEFMRQGFRHLEQKIDDLITAAEKRDQHYQQNFRELYNENKLQNERAQADRERIVTEMDSKLATMGNRLHEIESRVTTMEAEKRQADRSRPFTLSVAGLIMTAVAFLISLLTTNLGG